MPVIFYLHKEGQFINTSGHMSLRLSQKSSDAIQVLAWEMEMMNSPGNNCVPDSLSFDECLNEALETEMRRNTQGIS